MSLSTKWIQRKEVEAGLSRSEDGRSRVLDLASLRMTIAVCGLHVIGHALKIHEKQHSSCEGREEMFELADRLLAESVCASPASIISLSASELETICRHLQH
jgi:hypothetical protein